MSDISSLFLLLALGAVVATWMKFSTALELAIREARKQCQAHGLQLLDETVGLQGVRLRRPDSGIALERCYGFEVSLDGADRKQGRLWMIGRTLVSISLPTRDVDALHANGSVSPAALPSPPSNVVPLRPRQVDRLN